MLKVTDPDSGKELWLYESQDFKSDLFGFREYRCQHFEQKKGYVTYANGSRHLRIVCLDCGEFIGDSLKKNVGESYPEINGGSIKDQFKDTRAKIYDQIIRKYIRIQRRNSKDSKVRYLQYLSSDEWARIREKVISRAKGLCEGCGEAKIKQVHHMTYTRMYNEMLFDLVGLCDSCHRICHPEFLEEGEDVDALDDLPCYGCRHFGGGPDSDRWCTFHDMHVIASLSDSNFCGPRARSLEGLK